MKRFLMRSLTSQLIALMLLTLLLSQLLFSLINRNERNRTLRSIRQDEFVARAMSVARLVGTTEPVVHEQATIAAGTSLVRYWLAKGPADDANRWQQGAKARLLQANPSTFPSHTDPADPSLPLPNPRIAEHELPLEPSATWSHITIGTGETSAWLLDLPLWNGFGLTTEIQPGLWLHAVYAKPDPAAPSALSYYLPLGIAAGVVLLMAILAARRVVRPLKRLAEAAEHLGRGEEVAPLREEGAEDIRATAEAFNRMQSRLHRFVEDRTRMIAAISHDLRTPITSLRLRAEFITDSETKEKMIATLDEMQAMTEATLEFSHEASSKEIVRSVDIDALVASLCEDLRELGLNVTFHEGQKTPWRCKPDSLRRAVRNLIENGVRYGHEAHIRLEHGPHTLDIVVEDKGPGMPEEDFERVFAPFVRLETSRNRETGGVGLGLAIARSIARSHGGDVTLANRDSGGFRVKLSLPRD